MSESSRSATSPVRRWLIVTVLAVGCQQPGEALDAATPRVDARCAECDDGRFCNGAEACGPDGRCAAGEPPCPAEECDEGSRTCGDGCADADGDGHQARACGGDDCDDGDGDAYPGAIEVCDPHHADEDCDPATYGPKDLDRDGFDDDRCCNADGASMNCGEDCDDTRRGTNPIVPEVCDRRDNDCDGAVDEEVSLDLFGDGDRDLHGDPSALARSCPGVVGFSNLDDDCDDTDRFVHMAQVEITDGVDNDCDGAIDEMVMEVTWYRDLDGDGFGAAPSGTRRATAQPPGYSLLATDCDDLDAERSPAALELCNGIDDDCSGDPDHVLGVNDWEDDDGDGQPDAGCPGSGVGRDCNDRDPSVYSGAPERCNRLDDDCDDAVDEACSVAIDAGRVDLDAGPPCPGGCDDGIACTMDECSASGSCTNLPQDLLCGPGEICGAGGCMFAPIDAGAPVDTGPPDAGACTAEICDAMDNDCDARTDEGFACVLGGSSTCSTSCGSTGTRSCAAGCAWSSCVPPAETCNNADDDCDAILDEGVSRPCGGSVGECRQGTETCSAGAFGSCVGATGPTAEICSNGLDEDCDAAVDEGC